MQSVALVGQRIEVIASAPAGVYTVLVAYDFGNGVWNQVELMPTDDKWIGNLPVGAASFLVQVVDMVGNVAVVSGEAGSSVISPSVFLPTIMR
ncbi:MAG: hypothetical protein IPK16_30520 [Anaerolineales bacterium]|nr:hypothetical protein [Anaerolineales bacterium]